MMKMGHYINRLAQGLLPLAMLALPLSSWGWGPQIHRVVGHLALNQLEQKALRTLQEMVGEHDMDTLSDACNWPDKYRATAEGTWTAPQHYINVPQEMPGYESGRDCRDGACVAGAITQYADVLIDPTSTITDRWQAWARICHFVGDIHQPLHVGFAHDRGGNDFEVTFRGQSMNLHRFWDRALFHANYPDWRLLATDLEADMEPLLDPDWTPGSVTGWAQESHHLARNFAYPPDPVMTREFTAEAWLISRDRIQSAGRRLARVINTLLNGNGALAE